MTARPKNPCIRRNNFPPYHKVFIFMPNQIKPMKKHSFSLVAIALISLCINGCTTSTKSKEGQQATAERKTLSLQNIDSSIKPGDDFYVYANGKWLDTATILPTEFRSGARLEMDFKTKANIKNLLEEAASSNKANGTIEQRVGDLYASGMDTVTINNLGYQPVKPLLQKIDSITDAKGVMRFVADQWTNYNALLIGQYVAPDDKNSKRNLVAYYQAGLGLPDRDYYFKNDAGTEKVVKAYKSYIQRMFMLTGNDAATAQQNATTIYNLEKQIAGSHRTNVDLRDPQANYNKMAVDELDKKMADIGWKELLNNLHIKTDSVNISQPNYYMKLNELLKTAPVATWKTYLEFHLLDAVSPGLSNEFQTARFEYYGAALSGQKQQKPRWERVYAIVDGSIGEDLGQLYVKKYFSAEAKQRMQELVDNLQKAF
jgi:putative endopeptidase